MDGKNAMVRRMDLRLVIFSNLGLVCISRVVAPLVSQG